MRAHRQRDDAVASVTGRAAGTQAAVLNASGYVTARRRATVSSKVTGKVVEINVEEGMAVKEGQVLARLDDATARASLALAEAQVESARRAVVENEVRLAEAKVTLGRVMELVRRGVGSRSDLDAAQATVDSTDARIAAARSRVGAPATSALSSSSTTCCPCSRPSGTSSCRCC